MMYNHSRILPEENWVNKLYGPVVESMIFINMLQEVEHAEGTKDERSPLEIELYQRLESVLELLNQHPDFKAAPEQEATPLYPIPIDYNSVTALSNVQESAERVEYNELLRACLIDFLVLFKIKKAKFSEVYGCSPNYLSRLLNGQKSVNFNSLSLAVKQFGFLLKLDRYSKTWEFEVVRIQQ